MSTNPIQPVSRRIATRDGTHINCRLYGAADQAPRFALIHSLAMDGSFWAPVAARLVEHGSVLAIDARGHGLSDKPAGPYTMATMADDLADVLAALNAGPVVVAGASMGGCVALNFAAAYPQRTGALGLIDTTSWYGETAPADWNQRAQKALADGFASMAEFQTTRWFGDAFRAANPDVVASSVEIFVRNDLQAYAEACRMMGAFDGRSFLPQLKLPTAVIVGDEDYAAPPAMAEVLHRGIAGSSYAVLKGARHLTPIECPDVIAAALTRLLEQI